MERNKGKVRMINLMITNSLYRIKGFSIKIMKQISLLNIMSTHFGHVSEESMPT